MKTIGNPIRASVGTLVLSLGLSLVQASIGEASPGSALMAGSESQTPAAVTQENARLARLLKEASFSPGVLDVVRLTRSGAEPAILIAHVQVSEHASQLLPDDIAYLDDNNVPDSIVASMMVRRAEVRSRTPRLPPPQTTTQAGSPSPSATVTLVTAPQRRVSPPTSTVTVIGRSDLRRGLSARNYRYGRTYGSRHAAYGRYPYHGPSYRRFHGVRVCR